ncbi:hypothetical protein [Clostridium subterminale]
MLYKETGVREGFSQGYFEIYNEGYISIGNCIDEWSTNNRDDQNMQVQIWQRIPGSTGQYKLYNNGFYHGGDGCVPLRKFFCEKGIYKLKFVSYNKNAYADVQGRVGTWED